MNNVLPLRQSQPTRLLVVGNGMATAKLLDELVAGNDLHRFEITVVGEEPHPAYNRILIHKVMLGADPATIVMKDRAWCERHRIDLRTGTRVFRLDTERREAHCSRGLKIQYDEVVLATGSRAVLPPIEGVREDDSLKQGVFLLRTIGDGQEIREAVRVGTQAVVVGGGLLGLEAAKALVDLGARVTVVHRPAGLMERQLDTAAGRMLAARLRMLGIDSVGEHQVRLVHGGTAVSGVELDDGSLLPCSVLLIACGVQSRVDVARASGIPVNRAIRVDDMMSVPGIPGTYAVGECAEHRRDVYGTVAPIYEQVRVLARVLTGRPTSGFSGARVYTRLKVASVDVASMGALDGTRADDEVLVVTEPRRLVYKKLVIRDGRLIGAQFVGDATVAARVLQMWDRAEPLPRHRLDVLCSEDILFGPSGTGGDAEVCNCHRVPESTIGRAIDEGCRTVEELSARTGAGTGCGSCRGELGRLLSVRRGASSPAAAAAS